MMDNLKLADALDEIIAGRNVERSVHDLRFNGIDLTGLFVDRLAAAGFAAATVAGVEVDYDERVAAFLIRNGKAYFGWVFIERFTETRSRKLFGSLLKNRRGDWAIQVPFNSSEIIYVRLSEKFGSEQDASFLLE